MKKIYYLFILFLVINSKSFVFAGDGTGGFRVGNGGGACIIKKNNEIQKAYLLDLVEGEIYYNFSYDRGNDNSFINIVKDKLNKIRNETHKKNIVRELNYAWTIKTITAITLSHVPDYVTEICKHPSIAGEFEQAANYLNTGNILYINSNVFDSMSNIDKAALILHEAIYAYDRKIHKNPNINSLFTRTVVAAIMSENSYQKYIDDLFESNFSNLRK